MYEAHFGLRRRPFPTTPDSQCWYPSTGHERAVAQLTQAVQDGEGLLLLTGGPGTGKTVLGQRLLEQVGPHYETAFLTNCRVGSSIGLLQSILYDLGLAHEGKTEPELRLQLSDHLLKNYAADRCTLLVLDEAQHLSITLLEELRLLGNLEGPGGKAVQVVLLAQEMLEEVLRRPALAAFQQRLGAQVHLQPLDVHEAADYLVHHLRQAGGRPETIMSDEALELLARGSCGIPRLLNRAGHTALRLACQAGAEAVDAEVVLESLAALGLGVADSTEGEDNTVSAAVLTLEGENETGRERMESSQGHRLFAAPKRPA